MGTVRVSRDSGCHRGRTTGPWQLTPADSGGLVPLHSDDGVPWEPLQPLLSAAVLTRCCLCSRPKEGRLLAVLPLMMAQ